MRIVLIALMLILLCQQASRAADTLHTVNAMRAYVGLRPFTPDPNLAQGAEVIAQQMASTRRSGHIGWHKRFGARAEGTGMRSGADPNGFRFLACYSADGHPSCRISHGQYHFAGASSVVGRDGRTYYVLLLR